MCSFEHDERDAVWGKAKNVILHVNTDGHVMHAFLNGKHIGTH